MNDTSTVQLVVEEYVEAVHVLPAALEKSRLATPVVSTPMLPTLVPAATEKLNPFAALEEPMSCEPKFLIAAVPVKLTCALIAVESISEAKTHEIDWRMRVDIERAEMNLTTDMIETSLSVCSFLALAHLQLLSLCIGT